MRTLESRRFVSGDDELRLSLVNESKGRLPFRIRLKHIVPDLDGDPGTQGVLGAYADEQAARAAYESEAAKVAATGWVEAPKQVGLIMEIPTPRGKAAVVPCAHSEIASKLPTIPAGKSIVCPECFADVRGAA